MTISKISASTASHAAPIVEKATQNILFRIQELVSRINTQLSRLSEQGQERSQTMKKEYRISSAKGADLHKTIGYTTLATSAVSFVTICASSAISFLSKEAGDKFAPLIHLASQNLIPGIGNCVTGHLSSRQTREQAISSLRQTEIGNEGQKSGEARDFQSELQQIIGALRELFKKASS
jgi:hypothetical protein